MPKKDFNQIAFDVVRQATGEIAPPTESEKIKASRKGGLKGGRVRSISLSPEQRSAIAKKAALARWTSKKT
jgi:hypothetical protein